MTPQMMTALLTWPAFGHWLPGPVHGRIEECCGEAFQMPEPDELLARPRRKSLKWPVVRLDVAQRQTIIAAVLKLAEYRPFRPREIVAAEDHVHLLFETSPDTNLHRLVQLIKGSLSRSLTVAAGDRSAESTAGEPLPHHKWWPRQYVLQRLHTDAAMKEAVRDMRRHGSISIHISQAGPSKTRSFMSFTQMRTAITRLTS